MKTFRISVLAVSALTLMTLSSCDQRDHFEEQFDHMRWMQGKWTMFGDNKSMTEQWEFLNDTSIVGNNFFVLDRDTFQPEYLSIKVVDSSIYYIAKVSDQNDGMSIPFLLTKSANGKHLFVNPSHDFPNNIFYENVGDTVMRATVSGHLNGEYKEQVYRMVKQPE